MAIRLNNALRDVMLGQVLTSLGSAELNVYDGSQPSTGGGATTANLLVTFTGITWTEATNGTSILTADVYGTSGSAGTATWARLSGTDGTSHVIDGNLGTAGTEADFVMSTLSFPASQELIITEITLIQPGE